MGKKGKTTTRHKEDNTFRFERFEDKLKKISTDVRLDIRDGRNIELGEDETYLFQCVEKWNDLNRTESFGALVKSIGEDIKTLAQILNQKGRILNLLLSHISDPINKASFEPAFGLIVAVSRDLESDFYEYFPLFFNEIIKIVTTSTKEETHLIEHGFKCYAYLIKYLRIQIKRDLKGHLKLFAPLLDPKNKKYVVDFACEAFSVVGGTLGKTNPQSFLTCIFEGLLKNNPERSIGVGILLFSIFKSVNNSIANHDQWPNLSKCVKFIELLDNESQSIWLNMLKTLMERILDYVKPDKKQVHWEVVETLLGEDSSCKENVFQLYSHMICHYEERMVLIESKPRILVLKKLLNSVNFPLYIRTVLHLYEVGLLRKCNFTDQLHELMLSIIEKVQDFSSVRDIDTLLKKNDVRKYFGLYLLPLMNAYCRTGQFSSVVNSKNTKASWMIQTVSETILMKNGFYVVSTDPTVHCFSGFYQPFYFLGKQKDIVSTTDLSYIFPDCRICCTSIGDLDDSIVDVNKGQKLENLLKIVLVASRSSNKFCSDCQIKCKRIMTNLIKYLQFECKQSNSKSLILPTMLLYYILEYFMIHASSEAIDFDSIVKIIFPIVNADRMDSVTLWLLKCLDLIIYFMKRRKGIKGTNFLDSYVNEFEQLTDRLYSGFSIVRALTLSVVINADQSGANENVDQKLITMLEAFLDLENITQCNPEFSPKMKKILTECQVIMNSEEASERCKKIVLKYTLGQMYRNYAEVWPFCVKVVNAAGQTLKPDLFWDVFGKVFKIHYDNAEVQHCFDFQNIPTEPSLEFEEVNFVKALSIANFCPRQDESDVSSEKLDTESYKSSLWKCLKGVNLLKEPTAYVISKATELLDAFNGERRLGNLKQQIKLLGPVFEFLEKCSRVGGDSPIWEKAIDMLTAVPKPIRIPIWKFIVSKRTKDLKNYIEFIDELIEKDSLDVLLSMRSDAVDVTLDQRFANETTSRRDLVMKIVLRILVGKERELKPKQRKVILRFVAGCSISEAEMYVSLCEFSTEFWSPKVAEMKINKIKSILSVWEYSFPDLLHVLLDQMCELSQSVLSMTFKQFCSSGNTDLPIEDYKDQDEVSSDVQMHEAPGKVPESVFEDWKTRAIKAARSCLVVFFEKFIKLNLNESTLNKIFEIFIWPTVSELSSCLNSSVSWILHLFNIWSLQEKYHLLLIKGKNNDIRNSPVEGLYNLLACQSTKDQVKDYIMNVFLNTGKICDDDENNSNALEPMEVEERSSYKILSAAKFFNSNLRIGLNILLYRKSVILNLLKETKFLKKILNGATGESWLNLIAQIVPYVEDEPSKESLCSIMMDTLILSKNKEENLIHALTACKSLLTNLTNRNMLLLKIGYCFTWIKDRRPRTALCSILEFCGDEFLYVNLSKANSWIENQASDVPNYSERHQGYIALGNRIRESFDMILYSMVSFQCFHDILHDSDLGTRTSAVNLLTAVAESVNTFGDGETKYDIRKFLDSVIIPRLKGGVKHQDDSKFADYLKVMLSFVVNAGTVHGTFKELYSILKIGKEDPEILTRLTDIKVNMKTRALNSLCKRVEDDGLSISASTLVSFILPLAHHYLFVQKSDSKSQFNELVDAAISVKRAVLQILPHDQYFKILLEVVVHPEKTKLVAKRYERVLISTLDSFHFDLTLGVAAKENQMSKGPNHTGIFIDTDEMEVTEDNAGDDVNKKLANATVVPKAAARKYLQSLRQKIIPKLRRYLQFDLKATHKLSRAGKNVTDEVRLKIPCTLALVKLLKQLPSTVSRDGINSMIPSLCNKMGDKDIRIRNEMRQTIVSVVKELGTNQLSRVISYLRASLQRGYKKHVLNYTVKHLLVGLEKELRENPGHVPVKSIIPICEDELFGVMEEEKDVQKIIQKTAEASRSNAHLLIKLCAKYIQTDNYNILIEPAIRQSELKKKEKIVKLCRKWLISASEGLSDNHNVNSISFLKWLHDLLLKDTIFTKLPKNSIEIKKSKFLVDPKDRKLITVVSRQGQGMIGGERKTTKSFLTEFSLTCLYNALKKSGQLVEALSNSENISLLDPFVEHLAREIKSSSKDVGIVALRCSTLIFQFELSSFQSQTLLDMFWTGGVLAIDAHPDMFNAIFKFLHAFLVRFPSYNISKQDLTLIFSSIQKQLHNDTCSAAALAMLKEILQIKLNHSFIKGLMKDVFENSIISPYLHINEGCRLVYLTYFSNYLDASKEQQLTEEVGMITRQLSYKIEQGRLSAVATLTSVISVLPEISFNTLKEFIFMEMLLALGNEQSATVKEKLYAGIQLLFKLEKEKSLMSLLIALLSDKDQMPNYDTFFLVAGCVINDSNLCDNTQFKQLLLIIEGTLNEDTEEEWGGIPEMTQQIRDATVFQCLNALKKCFLKRVDALPLWSKNGKHCDTMKNIFKYLRDTYMYYEHEWVPLTVVRIFGIMFTSLSLPKLKSIDNLGAFVSDENELLELVKRLWNLHSHTKNEELAKETIDVMFKLLRVTVSLKSVEVLEKLVLHFYRGVQVEVVKHAKDFTVRRTAYQCFSEIASYCSEDSVESVAEKMIRIAVRDLTDDNVPHDVKVLAEQLTGSLRNRLGNDRFNFIYADLSDKLHTKRHENKAKKKEIAVLNPEKQRKRPKKPPFNGSIKKRKVK